MFYRTKKRMKRCLAGFAAFAMLLGNLAVDGLAVQAEEAAPQPQAISSYTSHIPDGIEAAYQDGDRFIILEPFGAKDEFVFGADVTFTNLEEQQSAALMFGIKDNNTNDENAMKANVHNKIDWNVPARVWGYGTDGLGCGGGTGQNNTFFSTNNIDVTKTFRMEVEVKKNESEKYVLTYSIYNTQSEKVTVASGELKDSYTGGRFGLMTYSSGAKFTNITLDDEKYGALTDIENGKKIHGVNGDAHVLTNVSMEAGKGFTYESDIKLAAGGTSAALTFGIAETSNPSASWFGANFNFNENNARVFKVQGDATDIGKTENIKDTLDSSKTIHAKLHVGADGAVTYELYNTDTPDNKVTVTGSLANHNYNGGTMGLLTFNSSAEFTNTTYTLDTVSGGGDEGGEGGGE